MYATDGLCSHEGAHLCQGLVEVEAIECPKHNARFHIPSGKAIRRPAIRSLAVHAVKIEAKRAFLFLDLAPS
ncbi:MAG: Rieske 2Fe-2S domain-containing protein [Rectinemataceae bacterium]